MNWTVLSPSALFTAGQRDRSSASDTDKAFDRRKTGRDGFPSGDSQLHFADESRRPRAHIRPRSRLAIKTAGPAIAWARPRRGGLPLGRNGRYCLSQTRRDLRPPRDGYFSRPAGIVTRGLGIKLKNYDLPKKSVHERTASAITFRASCGVKDEILRESKITLQTLRKRSPSYRWLIAPLP